MLPPALDVLALLGADLVTNAVMRRRCCCAARSTRPWPPPAGARPPAVAAHAHHATLRTVTGRVADLPGIAPFPIRADGLPKRLRRPLLRHRCPAPGATADAAGITSDPTRYHYRPLYHIPALAGHAPATPCRNAERLTSTLLTVPCHEAAPEDAIAEAHRFQAPSTVGGPHGEVLVVAASTSVQST
jgi:hypothetical protein